MKVAVILCNDMHMDIDNANQLVNRVKSTVGYEVANDYTIADCIIILTCAFGPNKLYSMQVIADVCINKKKDAEVIVTGCLERLCKEELKELEKESKIKVKAFEEVLAKFNKPSINVQWIPQNKVIISTGCNHRCSYCVYPQFYGEYHSKSMQDILQEVSNMYPSESTIYITGAQETSDYGVDLYGKRKFAELMTRIVKGYPDCRYVIGWFHPAGLTDEVIELIGQNANIVEIMLHIQHSSPSILKSMNRPLFEDVDKKINALKRLRPDLIISTEVIVGYPGETESEFRGLVQYLEKGYFSDIGVASYEPVEGTKAAELPNQIEATVKQRRMRTIEQRFSATCYPAPEREMIEGSILGEYFFACHALMQFPKNIIKASYRQKHAFIAGTDTAEKLQYVKEFEKVILVITNARSQFEQERAKKVLDVYTADAKRWFYEIIERGEFKDPVKNRAKSLLLEKNSLSQCERRK